MSLPDSSLAALRQQGCGAGPNPLHKKSARSWRSSNSTHGNLCQRVELLTSEQVDVAVALGIHSPAILLPASWVAKYSHVLSDPVAESSGDETLCSILAHELAHIRHRDLHWLAVSRVLMIVLWAQPLYWLLRRRMRLDQETLADIVAADLSSRQSYAGQLVGWAREMSKGPSLRVASAVGLWEGPSQLRERIAVLLDDRLTIFRECSRHWRFASLTLCALPAPLLSVITLGKAQTRAIAQSTVSTDAAAPSPVTPEELADFPTAVANRVGLILADSDAPFLQVDAIQEIESELRKFVESKQPAEPLCRRKQAILEAISQKGSKHIGHFGFPDSNPTDIGSFNSSYLGLPSVLRTLEWKIYLAMKRGQLTDDQNRAQQAQRHWMSRTA